jgi:hypothetical protein
VAVLTNVRAGVLTNVRAAKCRWPEFKAIGEGGYIDAKIRTLGGYLLTS